MKQHLDPNSGIDPIVSPGRLLNVNQVADVLGCGRTFVYELLGRGELRRVKIGRLTRVASSELDGYLPRQMSGENREALVQHAPRRSRDWRVPALPF